MQTSRGDEATSSSASSLFEHPRPPPPPTFIAITTRSRGDTLLSEDIFIVFSCRLLQFIVLPKGSEKEELLFPHFIDVETEA